MATGDLLLDALGNRLLDSSGNLKPSNGAGDACCCGPTVPPGPVPCPCNRTALGLASSYLVTFTYSLDSCSATYHQTRCGLSPSGSLSLPITAPVGFPATCSWGYFVSGTCQWNITLQAICTGTPRWSLSIQYNGAPGLSTALFTRTGGSNPTGGYGSAPFNPDLNLSGSCPFNGGGLVTGVVIS